MHGAGNDYIYINTLEESIEGYDLAELARALSDRHFGIGSDGLILIEPSRVAHFRMRMFNADGSEAEMCGNGIRCFAKYVYDRGLTGEKHLEIETGAGIIRPRLFVRNKRVHRVRVDMGEPRTKRGEIPMKVKGRAEGEQVIEEPLNAEGERHLVTCVSMGNPHCVLFVKRVDDFPVAKVGPAIENHPYFPQRTNVEFIEVLGPRETKMRVWERGAGETLACGTGACASVVAGHLAGKTGREVTVHLRGGDLEIEWTGDNRVHLTGPAEDVFDGEVDAEGLMAAMGRAAG